MTTYRFDDIGMVSARVTPEGWIIDRPALTRTGIFEYRRADGTVRREYRPPEEVFDAEALESIRNRPVTLGHPPAFVTASQHEETIIGSVQTAGERKDEAVVAEVVIYQPRRMGNRRELSLGYSVVMDETPGITPSGEKYDARQTKIRVNHLAVVEKGRAGIARLRLDSEDAAMCGVIIEDEEDMADIKLTAVRVDGIEYQASPEVARHIERLTEQATTANQRADKAEAERDTLKTAADKHKDALAAARADGEKAARNRLELEAIAKKHGVEVKADMADRAVREAVVSKLNPALKFDGKSDDYVQFAFDSTTAEADKAASNGQHQAAAASGGYGERGDGSEYPKQNGRFVTAAEARRQMTRSYGA